MQTFIDYLPYIVPSLLFLCNVLSLVYTRKTGKSIHNLEDFNMTYRNADYRANPKEIDKGTSFPSLIPRFRLDKSTGQLVETDPLDITKLVNSSRNVELKSLLSALEAGTAELTQQVKTQYNDYTDTLDELANALDIAEEYRERFGLDEDVSIDEIFNRIESERDKLKASLDALQKQPFKANDIVDKEVTDNASENVKKAE